MDFTSLYSVSSFGWLTLQSIPLATWPSFVVSLLTPDYSRPDALERHLARTLGYSQLAIGALLLVLTGTLPLTSTENPQTVAPFANAAVLVSTLYHAACAADAYVQYDATRQAGYVPGAVGSGVLAAFGLWCLLFGGGSRISRTGADKRTSGFPFKNAEAERKRL